MEFNGRIKQLLPKRSGTSARTGNTWEAQPFVFEYFENPTDRYADSVLLETFDTNVMRNMKEGMEVRCGFGHKVDSYQKDGKNMTINNLKLYKFEFLNGQQPANQPAQQANDGGAVNQPTPQVQAPQTGGNQEQGGVDNDLPF